MYYILYCVSPIINRIIVIVIVIVSVIAIAIAIAIAIMIIYYYYYDYFNPKKSKEYHHQQHFVIELKYSPIIIIIIFINIITHYLHYLFLSVYINGM